MVLLYLNRIQCQEKYKNSHKNKKEKKSEFFPPFSKKFLLNKLFKILKTIERLIHRSKSNIHHRINLPQRSKDIFSNLSAQNLRSLRLPLHFQITNQSINHIWLNRSLCKCEHYCFFELSSIIHLLCSVFFDHNKFHISNPLKGRIPMPTPFTFPSPSNHSSVLNHSRINYFRIHITTFRTFHIQIPYRLKIDWFCKECSCVDSCTQLWFDFCTNSSKLYSNTSPSIAIFL